MPKQNHILSFAKATPLNVIKIVGVIVILIWLCSALVNFMRMQPNAAASVNTVSIQHPAQVKTASQKIWRLNSGDPNQYDSDQWDSWSSSSCFGCSVAAVFNAYGIKNPETHGWWTCGQVLRIASNNGDWTVHDGLLGKDAWMHTPKWLVNYGVTVRAGDGNEKNPLSLDDLIEIANRGHPVIIGLTHHILVIKGGSGDSVFMIDSNAPKFFQTINKSDILNGIQDPDDSSTTFQWDHTYLILQSK